MQQINLLIAVASKSMRESVTEALAKTETNVVAIVSTCESAQRFAKNPKVNFLLLETELMDGDSLSLLDAITTARPELPVIMLSSTDSPLRVLLADECGASAYLSHFDSHELIAAIHRHQTQTSPHPASIDDRPSKSQCHGLPLPPWSNGYSYLEHN